MKNKKAPTAPLGITGNLQSAYSQVRVTLSLHLEAQRDAERLRLPIHDELIRRMNSGERAGHFDPQNQGIIQAPWSLQYRPAPGATSEHRNTLLAAKIEVDLPGRMVGVTEHNKVLLRLPEPEDRAAQARLCEVEQHFVTRQVLGWRGHRHITVLHRLTWQTHQSSTVA